MNWKRILVPHDFSASANHALAVARDEAKAHGSAIVMLHVIELPYQFRPDTVIVADSSGAPVNLRDYAITQADAHLADLAARLAKDSATATTAIRIGSPADEINTFVDEHDVDLVIMGTHGRSGLAHMLVGSVTERVVRSSKVPVLTIRHHA
jgi:nucleotide-binding universal stress UspA family protein